MEHLDMEHLDMERIIWRMVALCLFVVWTKPATCGEVELYLLSGQSNMSGVAKAENLPADAPRVVPHAFFHFGRAWKPLDLDKTRTAQRKLEFGPELGLALETAAKDRPVYIAKYAASGMGLHHGWHAGRWSGEELAPNRRNFYPGRDAKDENQGQLYRGMLKKFQMAIEQLKRDGHTPVIRGFVWMQGEQDSKHSVSATTYAANLGRLHRRLAEDLGIEGELPLVFGQVLPHQPAASRFTHRDEIREQMKKVGELPNAKMVSTDGFGLRSDKVHYNAAGQLRLGREFARELRSLRKAAGNATGETTSAPTVTKTITTIPAFFAAHCTKCHNAEENKSGVNFDALTDFRLENAEHWQEVLGNIQRGDMPPEDAAQPTDKNRRRFLSSIRARLDRLYADSSERDFRLTRLTNSQIAWSLRDLLKIDRDFSGDLIEDPVGKRGESLQSSLELTGGHMELYLSALQNAVQLAVPDLDDAPAPYLLRGNDWEKQHYLNRNDLAHGPRRKHKRYRGPKWLEDKFEVPLPPNHFFRIYVDDNRPEGQFRARISVRNEPPQDGGDFARHEFSLFFDKGFKSAMHTIGSFTVEAKPGTQVFEVFGNIYDFPGVDPAPLAEGEQPYGISAHFKYRFLTIQNCSPLHSPSDKPVTNPDWVIRGDGHFVRADDRWIDAWGEEFGRKNWLKRSHGGSDHTTNGKPSVYKDVMKDTSYAVIERIEFEMPWQWPPASVLPFLEGGQLSEAAIAREVKVFAQRAWRRPLTDDEGRELDAITAAKLKSAESNTDALRDLLMTVLADTRFLFYTDVEDSIRLQNFELVSRLAGFLWRTTPDRRLAQLADRDGPIRDEELAIEVRRMIADRRSERFVTDFTSAWMAFSKLDQIAINPNYYRQWNPKFKEYMKLEAIAFLSTLLHEDLSCLNCLSSDFVVVNDMMAKYYGMPTPDSGHRFSRVPAPERRGSALTQAAFLMAHSDGEDAHAVNRGLWLRSRLLGDPARNPPPGVPGLADLDARTPGAGGLSTKERLARHRTGICYDCHRDIDPWGVAMEAYDATGMFRQRILRLTPGEKIKRRNLPVVNETEIRGRTVAGMDELRALLREQHADDFARGFSGAMFSFALGRPLNYREDDAVTAITNQFKQNKHRMADLIEAIVLRPEFRHPNGDAVR